MVKGLAVSIRVGVGLGVLTAAASLNLCAENAPDPSPERAVIPSRKATKFLLHNMIPEYPAIAKINYIQGRVSIQTFVDDSGRVREAHAVNGHPFLAVAALKAIRNWLFKPAQSRQGPAKFLTYLDVKFSLHTRKLGAFPDKPEADLIRQVRPPELVDMLPELGEGRIVRMKILVGPDGQVLDSVPVQISERNSEEARRVIADWSFRPARWGAIAVPWYLEVDVPIDIRPAALSASAPSGSRSDLDNNR